MGWHLNDLTAASLAPLANEFRPKGYAFEAQRTQHVIYVGQSDLHIHELWWDSNVWHHNDLTAATGAPSFGLTNVTAYVFADEGTQHVDYLGTDGHIHELWWDSNGWHHNDLTAAAGAPLSARSDPTSYAFGVQKTQHVDYLGTDGHVHELWWNSNGWHHNDLTATVGAPTLGIIGPDPYAYVPGPAGYTFEAQRTQHVVYGDSDLHIHELWWNDDGWHHNDLTAATSAPLWGRGVGSAVTGYVFAAQATQHVVYWGSDFHTHELWWDLNGWHHNDLTTAAGAPPPAAINDLFGYAFEAQCTQHVVYQTTPGGPPDVLELWWDSNGWHYNALTAAARDTVLSDPTGYVFNAKGTQHLVFSGNGGHIFELYWVPDPIQRRSVRYDP